MGLYGAVMLLDSKSFSHLRAYGARCRFPPPPPFSVPCIIVKRLKLKTFEANPWRLHGAVMLLSSAKIFSLEFSLEAWNGGILAYKTP
jgi:hypothetical protein